MNIGDNVNEEQFNVYVKLIVHCCEEAWMLEQRDIEEYCRIATEQMHEILS